MRARHLLALTGLAMLALPVATTAAHASAPAAARAALPPGVVALNGGEPCPPGTLCLYRDYRRQGPAYGIGAGYHVTLADLPMSEAGGSTAADNVSSWVNNTESLALLIDTDTGLTRPLFPHQDVEEPSPFNDTVDLVTWP